MPEEIWKHYDRRTLIYDIIHLAAPGLVRVYLPRLLNLAPLIEGSTFHIDAHELRPSRRKVYRRFETIDFRIMSSAPQMFGLSLPCGTTLEAPINPAMPEEFCNRRVIYTMLKDENLQWIEDWLKFHNLVHGADAVLIADNASSRYSSEELLNVVLKVPGYVAARVLSVPLPWGPRGNAPGVDDGKYLQTTLLNLTRDRFFANASGVLNLDVDELLLRRGPSSVFDRVKFWGLVTFPGEWRYPAEEGQPVRHKDHRFRDPKDKPCATKYCFRPASVLGKMCLSVHGLERISRKLFSGKRNFLFLHCRNISTSWKYDRARTANSDMVLDSETVAALDAVFMTTPPAP
ncbi:MAG: hypothetical protein ACK4TJ_01770 [Tabrizicola sp.]